jgi:CubicO group peptidase (beta-lactamase class C family)
LKNTNLFSKTKEEFIKEILKEGTYATREELIEVLNELDFVAEEIKDKSDDEIVDIVVKQSFENVFKQYRDEVSSHINNSGFFIPGFTTGVRVNNINIKVFGGVRDLKGNPMESDTMFDVASITKTFTQVLLYSLIEENEEREKEKRIYFDSIISELHPKFKNLNDITIRDITTFSITFNTPGRIDEDNPTVDEARECLFNVEVIEKGKFNNNDIGPMILKEVMEYVTGCTYEELLDRYIVAPLGLKRTMVKVPENLLGKITGSPNIEYGRVNDSKANALGGFSGHAGVWSSSDDLIAFAHSILNGKFLSKESVVDFYTPNQYEKERGRAGNVFVPSKECQKYISSIDSLYSFVAQGSTRTQVNAELNGGSTILFNTATFMNEAKAKELDCGVRLVERDGVTYACYDIRSYLPIEDSTAPLSYINAKTRIKLMFLEKLIQNYDPNYEVRINIEYQIPVDIRI